MKSRHLGVLIAAAILAVVAGLWTSSVKQPGVGAVIGTPLLPGLAEAVNEVTELTLTGPGEQTFATMSRDDETWRLAERAGHRADVPKVRELILKLSRAKLLEEKTSNPEYYERLGVDNIDAADAGGVLVELSGVEVAPVIIGSSERAREAVYARRAGEPTSWLVSGNIEIADETLQWLGRDILDIDGSRIAEVEITHPDGEVVLISKSEFGQPNFDVTDIPDGRELERANIANATGNALAGLTVDDVMREDESEFADLALTRVTFRAFDGFVLDADLATRDDDYYVRFTATADAEVATRYLPKDPDQPGEDSAAPASSDVPVESTGLAPIVPPVSKADISAVMQEAVRQNKALAGWVYLIPKSKYDAMTRRMDDLLKETD